MLAVGYLNAINLWKMQISPSGGGCMASEWGKVFKAALVLTVVFGLCAFWALSATGGGPPGPEERRMLRMVFAVAVLSGFLTSLVTWWAIVGRAHDSGVGRGLISGLVSGVLIHPVCWSLICAGNSLTILLGMSSRQPLGELPLTVGHELVAVFSFSVWSILFYGWLTVVAGALAGGALGGYRGTRVKIVPGASRNAK
jgi:hypothetical protein